MGGLSFDGTSDDSPGAIAVDGGEPAERPASRGGPEAMPEAERDLGGRPRPHQTFAERERSVDALCRRGCEPVYHLAHVGTGGERHRCLLKAPCMS